MQPSTTKRPRYSAQLRCSRCGNRFAEIETNSLDDLIREISEYESESADLQHALLGARVHGSETWDLLCDSCDVVVERQIEKTRREDDAEADAYWLFKVDQARQQ